VKKRILGCTALGLALLMNTACLGVATPAQGLLITDVKWDGGGHGAQGRKTGRACATSILGLVAKGDASVEAAAKAGRITTVSSVDHYTKWMVFSGEYCTIVHGS